MLATPVRMKLYFNIGITTLVGGVASAIVLCTGVKYVTHIGKFSPSAAPPADTVIMMMMNVDADYGGSDYNDEDKADMMLVIMVMAMVATTITMTMMMARTMALTIVLASKKV